MPKTQQYTLNPFILKKLSKKHFHLTDHIMTYFLKNGQNHSIARKKSPLKTSLYKIHGNCTNLHCKTKSRQLLL